MKRYEVLNALDELEKRGYSVKREDGRYIVSGERGVIKFEKFDGRKNALKWVESSGGVRARETSTKGAESLDVVIAIISAVSAAEGK